MEVRDRLYIDGAWVAPARTDTIDVLDSTTEEVIGTIPSGTAADVDRAIRAARAAFEGWARISAPERAKYTSRIAEGLGVRMTEISQLIAREVGTPSTSRRSSRSACRSRPSLRWPRSSTRSRGRKRSETRWLYVSRSGLSVPSRRGTTLSTRSPPRWLRRWQPAAPSCSSRAKWHR